MKFDVMVVGGGPCGATAALFLARDGHRVGLIDPLGIGGQLINVEHIVDYPGFPTGVAGWDLAAAIGEQALAAGVELVMGTASAIRPVVGDGWRVQVDIAGHPARAVLLATGTRPTPLPGAEQLEGRGVSYCASCDGGLFAGRPVAVIGGGGIALAEALSLAAVASDVTVVVPGPTPTASAASLVLVRNTPNIRLVHGQPVNVVAENGRAVGIDYCDPFTGATHRLVADGVFGGLNGIPNAELAADFAPLGADGGVLGDGYDLSGAPGLFVAGEVRSGATRRAVAAAGEGAAAAEAISRYLAGLMLDPQSRGQ